MRCVRFLIWGLGVLCVSTPAQSMAERVRLELSGPLVPYERIEYAIEHQHGAIVARISATTTADFGETSRIALVTSEEWVALAARLKRHRLNSGNRTKKSPRAVRYIVEIPSDGRPKSYVLDDPELEDEPTALLVIDTIRDFVTERTGPLAFWDMLLLPEEAGTLRIRSIPDGHVRINGVELKQRTPISGVKLPVGRHTVEIIHPESAEIWSYPIQIKAERTTLLNVTLK